MSITTCISNQLLTYIDTFVYALADKYELETEDVFALWQTCLPKKRSGSLNKSGTKIDRSTLSCCKHKLTSGDLKGYECGKKCIGDYCSTHNPDKKKANKPKKIKTSETIEDIETEVDDVFTLIEPMFFNYELTTDLIKGRMKREYLEPMGAGKFKASKELTIEGYPVKIKGSNEYLVIMFEDGSDVPRKCTYDVSQLNKKWRQIHSFVSQLEQ
jgi:hypothetical protein